jgi:hypothetical protein
MVASVLALAACGTADNPYAKLADPPLVSGRLYTVTLASADATVADAVTRAGWQAAALPPNYPQADAVQASIWGVPEPVARAARHFRSGQSGRPDLRLLQMPLAARGRAADRAVEQAFFRNVLGADVPRWPLPGGQPEDVRVQAWTYQVSDIVAAAKRLRANGIPVVYNPVEITTAYQGDHRTLAIRAPDGTVVQLVQSVAQ